MTKLTRETLMDWFGEGYAGFYGKDGDYTDVVIDGHYDLAALEKMIDDATAKAVTAEREAISAEAKWMADQFGVMGNEKRRHKLFFQRLGENFLNFAQAIQSR